MTSNPVQHYLTKHIEINLHFVRERVAVGVLRVLHVPTSSRRGYIHQRAAFFAVYGVQDQSEHAQWLTIRLRGCVSKGFCTYGLKSRLAAWACTPCAGPGGIRIGVRLIRQGSPVCWVFL